MARQPQIPLFIKERVITIYEDILTKSGPPTGKEVYHTLHEEQGKRKFPVPLPSLRMVQLLLTKARPGLEKARDVDQPWSLGASTEPVFEITPEATNDLLQAWKFCIAVGHQFTIREARWVARLRSVICDRPWRIVELLDWAHTYALRERVCEILGVKPVDTTDIDSVLALSLRQRVTARVLGAVQAYPLLPQDPEGMDTKRQEQPPFIEGLTPGQCSELAARLKVSWGPGATAPKDLSEEDDWIYALCLVYLKKGPMWRNLFIEQRENIKARLREWIAQEAPREEALMHKANFADVQPADLIPTDVLKEVGYDVQESNKQGGYK